MPTTDVSTTAGEPCTSQASAERADEEPSTSVGEGDTESEQAAAAQDSELLETPPVMPKTPATKGIKRPKRTDMLAEVLSKMEEKDIAMKEYIKKKEAREEKRLKMEEERLGLLRELVNRQANATGQ